MISKMLAVLVVLVSISMVSATQYSITIDGSGTYTAPGNSAIAIHAVSQPPSSNGAAAGSTLVTAGTSGFLQLDVSLLQSLGVTLDSITVSGGSPTDGNYDFFGSQTAGDIGVALASGTSFNSAFNGQWPTDSTGTPYQYISIACNGNSQLIVAVVIVTCVACEATTTTAAPTGTNPIRPAPPGANGDPQFFGLQHQNFQFHGMADEVFNLVSSPDTRVNSLFKYIASGSCDYNDTVCWTHPGTYLDQIGLTFGNSKVVLKSGSHDAGMKVYINDKEITASTKLHQLSARNATATIKFSKTSTIVFESESLYIRIINSDYFFNFDFGLKDVSMLRAGAKSVSIVGEICELEARAPLTSTHKSQIKQQLTAAYPAYPLHGLIGQTWRNAIYCGRYFEGTVDDYVTGDLFANSQAFNFFNY